MMTSLPSTIQFQGRWNLDEGNYCATWCGSSLHFRTTSRSICLELGDLTEPRARQGHPNILWNFGSPSETYTIRAKGPTTLFLKPETGTDVEVPRDVTIMLCDWGTILHILDIRTTDGHPILAPTSEGPVKPMLFTGASLVSGFSPPFRSAVLPHGTYQAFASVAARILRARGLDIRLEIVAYPGLKLLTTEHAKGLESIFWDGREGFDGWDTRSSESPHDIFICIGSNDQAWGEDKEVFLEHYKAFIIRLRDSYRGSCKRIYVISPFGWCRDISTRRTVYEPDVQRMVEALAQTWVTSEPEGTNLYHISTEGWVDKSLVCDGLHPTLEGHERIGAKLIEYLELQDVL